MATSSVPLVIKSFLTAHIESVTHLDVLNFFINDPQAIWNANKLSQELRSHPSAIARLLKRLEGSGLIKDQGAGEYSYQASEELDGIARSLQELYKQSPSLVIEAIYEKPTDKLKGFADAFRLKKD